MALLVFVAGNGVALSEHICNTSGTHDYSVFWKADCKMERKIASCCAKKIETKKGCCQHKQFFKKLPIEGFTAKQTSLKSSEKIVLKDFLMNSYLLKNKINFDRSITGIPPPYSLYTIKYLLRPTSVELQIFRC